MPELTNTKPNCCGNTANQKKRHGHPEFYRLLEEFADLHSNKNHDYAAGGDELGNFKRVAQILSLYPRLSLSNPVVVALTYAMKQIDAVLWMLSNGHKAIVEEKKPRLTDIAIYATIAIILENEPWIDRPSIEPDIRGEKEALDDFSDNTKEWGVNIFDETM